MAETVIDLALRAAGVERKDRYSLKEARVIIGTSLESLRRKLRDGTIKGQRFGKKWLFIYHEDLKKLLG